MIPLSNKYLVYSSLIRAKQDEHGFIEHEHCDALLFTGLVGCLPEINPKIDAAYDPATKMWHRRPIEKSCFPVGSSSTISRDMLLGLAWYCYHNKRLDISEQVIKYAMHNFMIMGKAKNLKVKLGRCLMSPALLATFAWVSYKLGGPSRWWLRWIPVQISNPKSIGFQAHLQVLHILLRKGLSGKKSRIGEKTLRWQHNRQMKNPLFAYAAGETEQAMNMLLNRHLWPSVKLPRSENRKPSWLMERDESEWVYSNVGHEHTGGDFLFVAGLLLGKITFHK